MNTRAFSVLGAALLAALPTVAFGQGAVHDAGAKIRFEYGLPSTYRSNNYNYSYRAVAPMTQAAEPARSFSYQPAPRTKAQVAEPAPPQTASAVPARRYSYQPAPAATAPRANYNYNYRAPRLHRWERADSKILGQFTD